MKRYIKSNSESNRKYYAYPVKEINRLIEDYLYWKDDLGEDVIVTEPVYYAYIANSGMTDIDVAFVSKDENVISGLSENSEDVRLLLDGEYRDEEVGLEFDEVINKLTAKGITVLDDESGTLEHLGDSILFETKIETLIDSIISNYGTEDKYEIYQHLIKEYGDRTIQDLYVSDKFSNMIIPVKRESWRF